MTPSDPAGGLEGPPGDIEPSAAVLAKLLRNAAETVSLIALDGRLVFEGGNPGPTLGYQQLTAVNIEDLLHPEDVPLYQQAREEVLAAPGTEVRGEVRVRHVDGHFEWVEYVALNAFDDPDLRGVVLTTRNATARRRSDRLLSDTTLVLEAVASARPIDDVVDLVRRLVAHQGDVEVDDLPSDPDELEARLSQDDLSAAAQGFRLLRLSRSSLRVASELRRRALVDELTGLLNRAGFSQALRRHLRAPRAPAAVLLFDLDRFKQVNDTYGHSAGDSVLVAVAHALRRILRAGDVAARFGGDEFAVLCTDLPGDDPVDAADAVGRRLALALATSPELADSALRTGASIGISLDHGPDSCWLDADAWIDDADEAMYEAKRRGRGRVVIADHGTRQDVERRRRVEVELRDALDGTGLELWFQPVVRLPDRTVIGSEALLRWRTGDGEVRSPTEFLQVAEESGLMGAISAFTLGSALRVGASWRTGSDGVAPVVGVNLSATQLLAEELLPLLRTSLADAGLEPSRLVVELTETVLAADEELVSARLNALADLGVVLALDDFGTGWSSLRMVRTMPFDLVKVDRSFIAEVGSDPVATEFAHRVIDLVRSMGRQVLAEGVEHEHQVAELVAAGCDYGQGWLFGRPVPADELGTVLGAV